MILNNINFSKKFLGLAATFIALTLISGVFVVFHSVYPSQIQLLGGTSPVLGFEIFNLEILYSKKLTLIFGFLSMIFFFLHHETK